MLSYDSPIPIAGKATTINMANIPDPSQAATSATKPGITTASANGTISQHGDGTRKAHHIWLVTGPAGVGKSSVAAYLAEQLGYPYIEGDEFHPPANIQKMSSGTPLTDADRWDWLTALREESRKRIQQGSDGVVLTCSALKQKYRDVIRVAGYFDHSLVIHFIYLSAPESLLLARVKARQGHYMGANMVHSQFDILEPPGLNETDVISVDVSGPLEEVQEETLKRVREIMREEGGQINGRSD